MVTFAPTNKNVVFVRQRVTIMQGKEKKRLHACLPLLTKTTFEKKSMVRSACLWMTMGFASLSEGKINICLKNVKKKLKTHNKKLYKNKIFDAKQKVFDGL